MYQNHNRSAFAIEYGRSTIIDESDDSSKFGPILIGINNANFANFTLFLNRFLLIFKISFTDSVLWKNDLESGNIS
jgi:hypothetical protein